jgi:hypothetical protein
MRLLMSTLRAHAVAAGPSRRGSAHAATFAASSTLALAVPSTLALAASSTLALAAPSAALATA